jgi:hypothetical protein
MAAWLGCPCGNPHPRTLGNASCREVKEYIEREEAIVKEIEEHVKVHPDCESPRFHLGELAKQTPAS